MILASGGLSFPPKRVCDVLHRAMATLLCRHTGGPCASCMMLVTPLVKPIARMVVTAGIADRSNRFEGFTAVGKGLDALLLHVPSVKLTAAEEDTSIETVEL